ncbi:MAG TPA: hydrogenase nickel incorporation protein HypB [Bryobacteraceae bacterium]|nr:hydrogenase nickel incorporation protein HypB [Bryobacteraceae bacterium]
MSQIPIERKVLNANDAIAAALRERFLEHGVFCLNLISSPGSGKTALLERTLERFPPDTRVAVLTGDIQTDNDARRLARAGFPVKQITTAGACHLDARMIEVALADWNLADIELLLIENVGNLVCPTSYDLGEHGKVVLMSVTEGEDKPLKYPGIFYKADLMLLTKIDLLPHLQFDDALACENARQIHPGMEIIRTSATTGAGIDRWMSWIGARMHRPTAA